MTNIAPGSKISMEITQNPSSDAAHKTLVRLTRKDPAIARALRTRKDKRPSMQWWRRGGKQWHHQMKSFSPARIEVGSRFELLATLDVLRDLPSVERFLKIQVL